MLVTSIKKFLPFKKSLWIKQHYFKCNNPFLFFSQTHVLTFRRDSLNSIFSTTFIAREHDLWLKQKLLSVISMYHPEDWVITGFELCPFEGRIRFFTTFIFCVFTRLVNNSLEGNGKARAFSMVPCKLNFWMQTNSSENWLQ